MTDLLKTPIQTKQFTVDGQAQNINFHEASDLISSTKGWDGTSSELDHPSTWFDDHVAVINRSSGTDDQDALSQNRSDYYTKMTQFVNDDTIDENEVGKTILVKIEKLLPIGLGVDKQNFYIFPQESDGNIVFFDTQVIPDRAYIYTIKTINLVKLPDHGICFVEVPHTTMTVRPMQPPQFRPQTSFHNYKNDKEKIRILLNLNSNEEVRKEYKGFTEQENSEFLENWSLFDPQDLRRTWYQYESEPSEFEIYKMTEEQYRKVKGYLDIVNNSIKLETKAEDHLSTLTFKTDFIKPFQNYYYIIRSKNSYEYYSNPSPIYKVLKTLDANESFLNVETVGFATSEDSLYMPEKTMAKLIQIIPSSYQTSLGENYDDISNQGGLNTANHNLCVPLPDLGIVSETIWSEQNRFKIRLTSRKTGKKIDLNLNFKLTK
jgi:hypothetical protein